MDIYRGEAIKHGNKERIKVLKKLLKNGFPTEFVNGGNPYFVAQNGFFDTSVLHVANNFCIDEKRYLKHFLSFSEDRQTALRYAHGSSAPNEYIQEVNDRKFYEDITGSLNSGLYDFKTFEDADHLIATFNVSGGKPIDPSKDVGIIKEYNNGQSKVLALKAYSYFSLQLDRMGEHVSKNISEAAELSIKDLEWLILVLDLIPEQKGIPRSSSGIVQHGAPLKIELCIDPINSSYGSSARFM